MLLSYTHRTLILLAVCSLAFATPATALEFAGLVLDSDRRPVAGATVRATAGAESLVAVTGLAGEFNLVLPDSLPTPVQVTVSALGFLPASLTVTDANTHVAVHLQPRPTFSGEVEVSGTRATVGETPVTLTNVTTEQIERMNWGQDTPMLLSQVPGFYAYNDSGNGIGYSYFFIRGFDMRRTAISLNGVPLNDAGSHSVFFIDLADFLSTTGDVQVQRGVGTNLYGGSAIGGSVDVRTRTPLPNRRLRVTSLLGSWNTSRWALEYDTGRVNDTWAATFRWSKIESDGYRDQSWVEMWNYYAAIERYGERTTTRVLLFGGPEQTHLAYWGVPKSHLDGEITGDRRRDRRLNPITYEGEIDDFFQPHYQLHHEWLVSDSLTLNNAFYLFEGDGFFEQYKTDRWFPEYDLEPFPGPSGELVDTTDLVRRRSVHEWDAGWIPRLEWTHGEGRGVLQAGASIRLHSGRHTGVTTWAQHYPPGLEPNQPYYDYRLDKQSYQPFVQESWEFNDRWSVLAGLTWTSQRYQMTDDRRKKIELREAFSYLLPRLGVTFKPNRHWSLFANLSRGGREPAFRDIYDPQDFFFGEPLDLEPEDLIDYEVGARRTWIDGYAQLNLYWLDFDNAIVFAGGLDNNGVPITANGAVMDGRGLELEAAWNPLPRWGARVALAYSDSTFEDFVEFDWDGSALDHSGNRVAASPDWLGSLEITAGCGPLDLLLFVRHVGHFYLDNTEDMRKFPEVRSDPGYISRVNDAHTVTDLSVDADLGRRVAELFSARRVMLRVRINNLTDELYTAFGFFDGYEPVWIPAATRGVYAGVVVDW